MFKLLCLEDLTNEMKIGFDEENVNNLIEKLEKLEFNIRKSNKEYLTNLEFKIPSQKCN